ncbi:MAG TPA: ABC transporter permease [Gammaproteobacteria bacterium]|nr:ABC transporter permease [Gammaproteobacteria bacterium]
MVIYRSANKNQENRTWSFFEFVVLIYCILILGSVLAAYTITSFEWMTLDYEEMDFDAILAPPLTANHFLGTDYLGRDLLNRLMLGTQAYLVPGIMAVFIAIFFGSLLGSLTIFANGYFKTLIKYTTELLQTMPRLVLLLLVIAIFEPDIYYIMLVIGITNIPGIAILVSRRIDILRNKSFIEASIANGTPLGTLIFKHILWYNCRALLIAQAALGMAEAVLMETSLSYLGFGVQEPTPSWGNMVQAGTNYLLQGKLWSSSIPAIAIMLVLLALYLVADVLIKRSERKRLS